MFELLLKYSPWAYRFGTLAFASGWPLWLLVVLIIAGIALVAGSLWRNFSTGAWSWPRALVIGALQSLFVATVLVLLWRPVLQVERVQDNKNVVAVVLDASASMAYSDSAQAGISQADMAQADSPQSRMQQAVQALQAGPMESLGQTFMVRLFDFAGHAQPLADINSIPPPGPQSHIGDALRDVLQTASSVPLAGVVVLTDGAETGNTLSEERIAELSSFGVPIHTVGIGPEQPSNDLELDDIAMPQSASPGEVLTGQVSIRHTAAAKTWLRVYDGTQLLAAREVQLSAASGVTTVPVEVPAGSSGVRDLRFTLDPLKDELNVANNSRSRILEVPNKRRSVLYIEGEPRWEYKFIRRAMENDPSVRLVSAVRATPNRYYRQGVQSADELGDGFPKDAAELFAYDAVIIGSLEATALSAEQHQLLKDFVDKRGGTLMLLAGRDGLADGGWGRVPIAQALPTHLPTNSQHGYTLANAKVDVTLYGRESVIGRLDADASRNAAAWKGLPDLADMQSLGELKPGAVVLLNAVSANKSQPLLVAQHFGRGSVYLFGTATTWRWKMRLPHDDVRHQIFWRQLLHALAAGAPASLALSTEYKVYDDEKSVMVTAELHDEKFNPIDGADVSVKISSEQGPQQVQRMQAAGDGRYVASIEANAAGMYRLELDASQSGAKGSNKAGNSTANKAGKKLGDAEIHIRRNDDVVEHFQTYQHRALLERIAQATGGRYWSLNDLGNLPDAIRYSKAGVLERQTLDLWNLPLVFLLLLALKGGEWLLRRHWRRL